MTIIRLYFHVNSILHSVSPITLLLPDAFCHTHTHASTGTVDNRWKGIIYLYGGGAVVVVAAKKSEKFYLLQARGPIAECRAPESVALKAARHNLCPH